MNGKSDHKTLTKAKENRATRAVLRTKKSPHLKDRDTKIPSARTMRTKKTVRSIGLPSSNAWAWTETTSPPSHCPGRREPAMKIQIKGTHRAGEVFGSLAGSQSSKATRSTNQVIRATEEGIRSIHSIYFEYRA